MDKKGQSALEYLMTYGWALVVIVIVIAALVFLINPSNVGGNTCTGFPNLVITNHAVSNTTGAGDFNIFISNNSGQKITAITFAGSSGDIGGTTVSLTDADLSTTEYNAGAKTKRHFTYTGAGSSGSYVVNLKLSYEDRDNVVRTETASCRGNLS